MHQSKLQNNRICLDSKLQDQTYICLRQMPVQGGGVELREAVNFVDIGVDAVGDGDVYESVIGS